MNYNFTDRVRKVLAMAREEAIRLQHDYVGTEHILLGLIREGEGVAAAVLNNLNVDLDQVQEKVEESVRRGKATIALGELPYTSRAKKVLEFAMSEARELNHSYVGTEHLLLGLLREEKGIGAQVLQDAGLELQQSRAEVLRLLGTDVPPTATTGRGTAPTRAAVSADGWGLDRLLSRCSLRLKSVIELAITDARTVWKTPAHSEHLLMALLHQTDGLAAIILQRLHVNVAELRDQVATALESIPRVEHGDLVLVTS